MLSSSPPPPAPDSAAGAPPLRKYYSDRQHYRVLQGYAAADPSSEAEITQQITCDVEGDVAFGNVYDTSAANHTPIS